jgi:hypothetical protein
MSWEAPQLLEKTRKKFDAVVNIGTSMGYYGKIEDQRIFGGLRKVTGPRGILAIETVNRDYLVKHFQDHAISNRGGVEWRDSRRLDLESYGSLRELAPLTTESIHMTIVGSRR